MAKMSVRRKMAIATWQRGREGNIYGKLSLNGTELDAYIKYKRTELGKRVTVTHVVGKAIGMALKSSPGLNGIIRRGRYVPHPEVSVAFLVALEDGKNLAKVKVDRIDEQSIEALTDRLGNGALTLRNGDDANFNKSMGPIKALPTFAVRWLINIVGFLTGVMGFSFKGLGLEAFPFGSCIITSVGMMGVDEAYVPPTPFAYVPLYVLIGAFRDEPVVIDGALAVQKRLTLTATIDHRYIDGAQGAIFARRAREVLEDPWTHIEGMSGRPADLDV
jgi:pyruvate dehydrogenase E2 component (dihydrolipoamide acetyltransferase)